MRIYIEKPEEAYGIKFPCERFFACQSGKYAEIRRGVGL